jgi:trafficking protein particle complex subunit 5
VVNKYISVPKDKGSFNGGESVVILCHFSGLQSSLFSAVFNAGILEAVLTLSGFNCKVTAHYHKGTTYMAKFEDFVISRDKLMD